MLDVCLLGCAGMMPLPRRRLTALMTRYNGSSLLIDCGEGTQVGVREQGWSVHDLDTICFTHYHADHISGLPGLLLTLGNADRTDPVLMIGPKGLQRVVDSLRVIAPELPFEIRYHEISRAEERIEYKGYQITAFRVNHNVTCYGYVLEIPRLGRFDPVRAKEQGIPLKFWNRLQHGETVEEDGVCYEPAMVMGEPRKGIKLTYCTDTRPVKSLTEHAAGSDLAILEGMYAEPEKLAKARQYKHMTFYEAAQTAKEAGVGALWLTHYSPSLVRPAAFLDEVQKIFPDTVLGKDGLSTELNFTEDEA